MKVAVKVRLKKSILDPQGKAIQNALSQLGFDQIKDVRIGKLIELNLDDNTPSSQIKPLAEKAAKELLANPVMEDYEIELLGVQS